MDFESKICVKVSGESQAQPERGTLPRSWTNPRDGAAIVNVLYTGIRCACDAADAQSL